MGPRPVPVIVKHSTVGQPKRYSLLSSLDSLLDVNMTVKKLYYSCIFVGPTLSTAMMYSDHLSLSPESPANM